MAAENKRIFVLKFAHSSSAVTVTLFSVHAGAVFEAHCIP